MLKFQVEVALLNFGILNFDMPKFQVQVQVELLNFELELQAQVQFNHLHPSNSQKLFQSEASRARAHAATVNGGNTRRKWFARGTAQ